LLFAGGDAWRVVVGHHHQPVHGGSVEEWRAHLVRAPCTMTTSC
jgi:hypothetical protein